MDFRPYRDETNPAVDRYRSFINAIAIQADVPACALAAIIEQESGGHNVFQFGMPPGPGCGVGLCQITFGVDWSNPLRPTYEGLELLDVHDNLVAGATKFLRPAIDCAIALRLDHGEWMYSVEPALLYWAFAAYNGGTTFLETCVNDRHDPDDKTTARYATRAMAIYTRNLERSAAAAKALR